MRKQPNPCPQGVSRPKPPPAPPRPMPGGISEFVEFHDWCDKPVWPYVLIGMAPIAALFLAIIAIFNEMK